MKSNQKRILLFVFILIILSSQKYAQIIELSKSPNGLVYPKLELANLLGMCLASKNEFTNEAISHGYIVTTLEERCAIMGRVSEVTGRVFISKCEPYSGSSNIKIAIIQNNKDKTCSPLQRELAMYFALKGYESEKASEGDIYTLVNKEMRIKIIVTLKVEIAFGDTITEEIQCNLVKY